MKPGWNEAKPAVVPQATGWPPVMALGIALTAWGLITSLIVLGIGVTVLAVSLFGWIGDIRHERH